MYVISYSAAQLVNNFNNSLSHSFTSVVDCGIPPSVLDGNVNFTDTVFSSQATYTCLHGYNITGDITRICLVDGTWSGSVPFCERKLLCSYTATVYCM